ncbi:xanthine dehydrogenase small subunit [Neoroseomonas oryzicola]|uniref:Xanthine dehydrogenase n=1 Tax=Neoroseomonas oryzicola TaxID=535904 RepID=A0A9X9WIB0_9PROT|nr:FAD binding domain-containing protein [Neoroseomonas oryzicola]MBR0660070.1 xanthine dehydrogenase [Neoroseomonas oryzicola]NKE18209.1 xanthine dehydrogenase [Neoroseomonas oryzicola]
MIRFTLNGEVVAVPEGTSPTITLLDWLRGPGRLPGTKEGCAEGDCGACTVVLENPDGTRTPVNACLMLLGQAAGRAIRTVEGLRGEDGGAHPVQQALAAHDGTQCGFCTPGIVMSAWAWTRGGGDPHEALAGNLCRCTGYRPILDAMTAMEDDGAPPPLAPDAPREVAAGSQRFFLPQGPEEALALRAAHPGAWLLAGGTDLGLRVSEHREAPEVVICLLGVPRWRRIEVTAEGILAGATASYARLLDACAGDADFAPVAALLRRLGSRQIRGMGTLGGNLGTASPIGDALPPLIALGARVTLASVRGEREMAVEDFLIGYRETALAADEIVTRVLLPRPPKGALLTCEKLSKRHDQDIATVGLSVLLTFADGVVAAARVAHGGCGPRAARAPGAEAALVGSPLDVAAAERAARALEAEVTPLSDLRGSAAYRRRAVGNLLRRMALRRVGVPPEVMALDAPGVVA